MTRRVDDGPGREELATIVRVEGARVLATLTRTVGDLQVAEDAVQDAIVTALETWPRTGTPDDPRAWLAVVARHKALDHLRREGRRADKEGTGSFAFGPDPGDPPAHVVRDDELRMIFTCCHPALTLEARVALSLRTLGGLTTAEIARALLVPESTMAKRLVRAKRKIAVAQIPYRVPDADELPVRLPAVLGVIYLIFTEGHRATSGDLLVRVDLCDEAVRLARLVAQLLPDEPEVAGLLALLLLTDARRAARVDAAGDVVRLADQDRTLWDAAAAAEGSALVAGVLQRTGGVLGPYGIQAALAAEHASAASFDETDWAHIVELYDLLTEVNPSPVVALNRAVAVAAAEGPVEGLAALDAIDGLDDLHLWHVARGEQLAALGRRDDAAAAFGRALEGELSAPERRLILRGLGRMSSSDLSSSGPAPAD